MKGSILVIKGQSLYNVLRIAADYMANAFRDLGYDVTVADATKEEVSNLIEIIRKKHTLIFSFQALLFNVPIDYDSNPVYTIIKDTPVFGHIVDHPIYHSSRLESRHSDNMYIGCIDQSHVDYILRYYPTVKHAVYLPHAGFRAQNIIPYSRRSIDVYFPSTYSSPEHEKQRIDSLPDVFKNMAYKMIDTLLANPLLILQNELEKYLDGIHFTYTSEEFALIMGAMECVDVYIRAYEREKCIQTLLENNIKVTVSGSNWDQFNSQYRENLAVIGENGLEFLDVLEIMGNSKIVLNNAPTYQYGTHERIFTSMMCGAISVTNDFPIIQGEFIDGENIILFKSDRLDELVLCLKDILENEKKAEAIALNGKKYAEEHHTWMNNAKEILRIVGLRD